MIPKKIFQTWKSNKISRELKEITETWKSNNNNYEYEFYDDEKCEFFLRNNFKKDVFDTYKKIIPGAFKTDLWRVCVLYKFGGFYCDLDTICLGSIDNFINKKTQFMAPIDLNENCVTFHNLFNSFIGSIAESKIMKFCIERIVYNAKNNITNIPALDFSACGVLGRSLNVYWGLEETSSYKNKEGNHNEIILLKFNKKNEIISDALGNYLFQNKNGNENIKNTYKKQCDLDRVDSWFNSKNWIEKKKFI